MRTILLVTAVIALAACEAPSVSKSPTNNAAVPVELLFEHEGCRVYRFQDAGRNHYFTNCTGSAVSTRTRSCGKNCFRREDEEIPTTVTP